MITNAIKDLELLHFKVGDKVKAKESCCKIDGLWNLIPNKIYTIRHISSLNTAYLEEEDFSRGFSLNRLELVNDSELEKLISIANEGFKACDMLVKEFADKIEYRYLGSDWGQIRSWEETKKRYKNREVRSKKISFEPFYILVNNTKHFVKDLGTKIAIGSQRFDDKELCAALSNLVRNSSSVQNVSGLELSCMRGGLICNPGNYFVSWKDVEKVLDALEKKGI